MLLSLERFITFAKSQQWGHKCGVRHLLYGKTTLKGKKKMKVQSFWKRSIGHASQKVKQDFAFITRINS